MVSMSNGPDDAGPSMLVKRGRGRPRKSEARKRTRSGDDRERPVKPREHDESDEDRHGPLSSSVIVAYPGSAVMPRNDVLYRMLNGMDKNLIIHVVLNWIDTARHSASLDNLPPQLSRKSALHEEDERKTKRKGDTEAPANDANEDVRATTYEELELIWCSNITTVIKGQKGKGRLKMVERILEVDWPQGLTFSMVTSMIFETVRANRLGREWKAMYLDYGDDKETEAMIGTKGAGASRPRLYRTMTPQQLKERFSAELKHFCTHAIFLDKPAKRLPIRSRMYADITPLPTDWTQPFTHVRLVNCDDPESICGKGLHILHIPNSPWFLVSGRLAFHHKVNLEDMAMAALAQAMGARRVRQCNKRESDLNIHGSMGELKGHDALALRDIVLSENYVQDRETTAGGMQGGKGREMRNAEAEDGPLVQPALRSRDDRTGLYEDVARREDGQDSSSWPPQETATLATCHPAELAWLEQQRRAKERQQKREAQELFGSATDKDADADESTKAAGDGALPRLERISYELHLPFPRTPGLGAVEPDTIKANGIRLRLDGTHVLAGLRKLVAAGLDCGDRASASAGSKTAPQPDTLSSEEAGLPSWLVEARGTDVTIWPNGSEEGRRSAGDR